MLSLSSGLVIDDVGGESVLDTTQPQVLGCGIAIHISTPGDDDD